MLHRGFAHEGFAVAHRDQLVTFLPGALEVDAFMRATIEASDADVAWDDVDERAESAPEPKRRGRPPLNRG